MARDQRARRLRLGDDVRRDHPPLSRLSDRRAAGAARPHRDAERSRGRDRARRRQRRQDPREPAVSSVSRLHGPAELALRDRRRRLEKSVVMPARHNIVHITFRSIGAERRVRLRLRPFINFRRARSGGQRGTAARLRADRPGRTIRGQSGPDLPTLRLVVAGGEGPTFTADGGSRRECLYPDRGAARLRGARLGVEPRLFQRESAADCP